MATADDQHRAKPRFDPTNIRCDKGKLVDLSASGLAVRSGSKWGRVGKTYQLQLSSPNGSLMADVEVVRIKGTGLFKTETGCRFLYPDQISKPLFDLLRERLGSAGGEFMVRSQM